MPEHKSSRYRGYDIVLQRQWSQWCASVFPTRAELPLVSTSALQMLGPRKAEALAEARQRIDRVLGRRSKAETGARPQSL